MAIMIDPADTAYLDYAGWDGTGPMTLTIDRGSDGTMDDTLLLTNQAHSVYIPLAVGG